jgi:MerR family transcriptional regulator, thiopeptide resistance regulator
MDTWSVGELAKQTGLTVRTLHHYDEIGLARPSQRTAAGHRRYTGDDVRRLHRVVALRGFGFSLTEIGALLDAAEPDPRELVRRQRDQATERIARTTRLRDRLDVVLRVFDAAGSPSAEVLVGLIEGMVEVDAAEFAQMAAHREAMAAKLSPSELAEMSAQREAYMASLTPEQLAELQRSRPPIPH